MDIKCEFEVKEEYLDSTDDDDDDKLGERILEQVLDLEEIQKQRISSPSIDVKSYVDDVTEEQASIVITGDVVNDVQLFGHNSKVDESQVTMDPKLNFCTNKNNVMSFISEDNIELATNLLNSNGGELLKYVSHSDSLIKYLQFAAKNGQSREPTISIRLGTDVGSISGVESNDLSMDKSVGSGITGARCIPSVKPNLGEAVTKRRLKKCGRAPPFNTPVEEDTRKDALKSKESRYKKFSENLSSVESEPGEAITRKKKKKWQLTSPLNDPVEEKRRRDAIKSKENREKKYSEMNLLKMEVEELKNQIEQYKTKEKIWEVERKHYENQIELLREIFFDLSQKRNLFIMPMMKKRESDSKEERKRTNKTHEGSSAPSSPQDSSMLS